MPTTKKQKTQILPSFNITIPKFSFSLQETVIKPIPLMSPTEITNDIQGLAVAYTPQQQVVQNILDIDPKRLNPRRAKKDDNSYDVKQLRFFSGSLNLSKSGNKKELVNRIKSAIIKVNPNTVFE